MSIGNELSCDVATAMLARRDADPTNNLADDSPCIELTDIVLEFHSTLRQLTNEARRRRRRSHFFPASQPAPPDGGSSTSNAASGSH